METINFLKSSTIYWEKSFTNAKIAMKKNIDFHIIYYKDLVTNTENCTNYLAKLLGIEFNFEIMSPTFQGDAWASNISYKDKSAESFRIYNSSIDHWKISLPFWEKAWIEVTLGKHMLEMGLTNIYRLFFLVLLFPFLSLYKRIFRFLLKRGVFY